MMYRVAPVCTAGAAGGGLHVSDATRWWLPGLLAAFVLSFQAIRGLIKGPWGQPYWAGLLLQKISVFVYNKHGDLCIMHIVVV